jgi:hypothetical protein
MEKHQHQETTPVGPRTNRRGVSDGYSGNGEKDLRECRGQERIRRDRIRICPYRAPLPRLSNSEWFVSELQESLASSDRRTEDLR